MADFFASVSGAAGPAIGPKRYVDMQDGSWAERVVASALGVDGATVASPTNPLPVAGQAFGGAPVTLTRTADTNAYTANDVIGAATGSTAALSFLNMGNSAGRIIITSAQMEWDETAIPSGATSFRLYLYSVTPASALGDNAAWDLPSGDRASFLGYVDLGVPADLGSTLYTEQNGINKQIKLTGSGLFGYLVTNAGYTPASASVMKITLHAVGL